MTAQALNTPNPAPDTETRMAQAPADDGRLVVKHDERRRSLQYSVHIDGTVLCGGRGNRYFGTADKAMAAGQRRLAAIASRSTS